MALRPYSVLGVSSHYRQEARLLTGVEHKEMLVGYIILRVCLRWGYFSRFLFATSGIACVQLAHSSLGDWKDIFINHLLIIIKPTISASPIVSYFPWLCVSDYCTIIFCHLLYIYIYIYIYIYMYIPGTSRLCFHYRCAICANDWVYYDPRVVLYICSHITIFTIFH